MENSPHIKVLFYKYLDGTISKDEYKILLEHFGRANDDGELYDIIQETLSNEDSQANKEALKSIVNAVEIKLRQKLQPKKISLAKKYLPYAAVLILFLMAGLAFYIISMRKQNLKIQISAEEIKPGRNAATLTLDNGKKILLSEALNGSIASEDGISIIKLSDGTINYIVSNSNRDNKDLDDRVNTFTTAKGETYQIVLSEGTKVWLNAATTLQYTANLGAQGKRKVKLVAGEAYFEVSKDKKHPFIVETPTQNVEVLGTHFNINSYADEGHTVTTLEEGSVKVSTSDNSAQKKIILKPGQQSIASGGNLKVLEADLQIALAWKEGKIYFRDASIQEVLRQVSRWYNIEIEYHGMPTKELFNGGIKRTANLSSVLRILELSNVKFKLTKKNNTTTLIVL